MILVIYFILATLITAIAWWYDDSMSFETNPRKTFEGFIIWILVSVFIGWGIGPIILIGWLWGRFIKKA